jgi:formylglycine-generating enzyme required for sulfatase activity
MLMQSKKLFSVAAISALAILSTSFTVWQKPEYSFDKLRQKGFVAAKGTSIDAATKLPTRIIHKASGIALVLIPAGEFLMGSPEGESGRDKNERQHRRVIHKPFYFGETEVTVGQFRKFVEATEYQTDAERGFQENDRPGPGAFASTPDGDRDWNRTSSWQNPFPNLKEYCADDNHPVVQVSWNDAKRFAEHYALQLPTEAQWEYAARAGSKTRFFWGEAESGANGYGNFKDASGRKRFPRWNSAFAFDDGVVLLAGVGKYRPNAWKVYDLAGNVSEWTEDVYRRDYPEDGADESAIAGENNSVRVIRGAAWLDAPDFNRSAKRIGFRPQGRRDFIGFRVAMNIN